MEPARLRALLARSPGLLAAHLNTACPGEFSPDLLQALLAGALPPRVRRRLEQPDETQIDADLRWAEAAGVRVLCCRDSEFPATLATLSWAPAALYLTGSPGELSGGPWLTIMGARQASAAGCDTARRMATDLAAAGVGIISALGEGIAAAALEGALAGGGRAIAVSAAGLDRTHPVQHARLAARIREHGSLVSQFPPGSPPRRHHFALRDRLSCALGAGTLVVEALAGSGLGVTAATQLRHARRVFAIPGSIRDPLAAGCNQLIRRGATLVQDPREILRELGINNIFQYVTARPKSAAGPHGAAPPLDNKYEMLLDAAGFEPVDIDVLAFRTGWSGHTVASMLLLLELEGRVAPQPGGRYCRL
ncbi:MAG TPA: DNA-processing protein DprA [Steroidobacteraceae bacterium]|nr:DNA-processing protein DprA [Steroidobacteraceae bacterium]